MEDVQAEYVVAKAPHKTKPFPALNTDEDILVLVDEAHRSHTNTAHASV